MANAQPNLFLRLHKWATRQEENFLTESLAVVLQTLLEREPRWAVGLVNLLSGGLIEVPHDEAKDVRVLAQVETEEGRPDLKLEARGHLAVIEVKVESDVRADQLKRYQSYLTGSNVTATQLVLLTRYPEIPQHGAKALRWSEVAEWLEKVCQEKACGDPVSRYLCLQFLEFLEARNMTIAQVNSNLAAGVRSLRNLLAMLDHAVVCWRVSDVGKSAKWDRIGFDLEKNRFWIGVAFDEPGQLRFQTMKGFRINPDAARALGVGRVVEKNWAPGGFIWRRVEDLDSEPVSFFSLSKVSQMKWLEEFLRECLSQARSIETPDQPPLPEEPEGN